ncbi:MAG: GerW family sporulation protein [Gemmiger sp.]
MEKIRQLVDANTIIGEPITVDGATIIPFPGYLWRSAAVGANQQADVWRRHGAGVPLHPSRFW